VLAAAMLLIGGCSQQAPRKPYVARVDQAFLSEDELASPVDSSGRTRQYRNEQIVEWVNDELLYQEALRRGLGSNPEVRRQMEATTKKLLIGSLLEKELYGTEENISEDEIVALYNGGGEVFRLREDVVNTSYALFDDRDAANAFRGLLVQGTPWHAAIEQAHTDSLLKLHLLQILTHQYFTPSTFYPFELWKVARSLGKDEVSFAIKTDRGYYILVGNGLKKQGEMPEFDFVRNELRDRILIERRRERYDKLLARLRTRHSVEVHFSAEDSAAAVSE
jgi:PPIC-type PPIASE domain